MEFIKKQFIGICIGAIGITCLLLFVGVLFLCLANGWGYYFFDVIAKSSPAIAGIIAYWIWRKNREKDLKQLEYKNDCHKKIIDQRIVAYMSLEVFISKFKLQNFKEKDKPHISFLNKFKENPNLIQAKEEVNRQYDLDKDELISKNNFWFSSDIMGRISNLIDIINSISSENTIDEIIDSGKKRNAEISSQINRIEKYIARDFLELYDVDKFLKSKQ